MSLFSLIAKKMNQIEVDNSNEIQKRMEQLTEIKKTTKTQ